MYPAAQERLHQALAHCFAQTLAEFLDWIFEKFPQCGETAAARIKVHGVVVNNPVAEERAIASFHKSLNRDVTDQCSYGKAVQHLTGRPLTLHGVAHYKDANIMLHDANLPSLLAAVQPLQKYESCEKDERRQVWDFILALVRLTQMRHDYESVPLPTSKEIAEDIQRRKTPQPSVHSDAVALLLKQCADMDFDAAIVESLLTKTKNDPDFCQGFAKEWLAAMDETVASDDYPGITYGKAVADGNAEVAVQLPHSVFHDLKIAENFDNDASYDTLVKVMHQVNTMISLQNSLPPGIIQAAQDLKNQVQDGQNIEPGALINAGLGAMSNCSPEELNQCLGSLMPQLTDLMQGGGLQNLLNVST
jgi:hypothetical protein